MKKLFLLCGLLAGTAAAQVDLDQPLNWNVVFSNKFLAEANIWRSLTAYPRSDVQVFDTTKAASGKIAGAYAEKMGLTEERLYQPSLFWQTCAFQSLAHTNVDYVHALLRRIGYKPMNVPPKTAATPVEVDQLEVWAPVNKTLPSIAVSLAQKCGGKEGVSILTVFQIGEKRHIAYGRVISDRFFGTTSAKEADTRVQLRSPTGAVRPEGGRVIAELYNTTPNPLAVSLRVDVRDQSGRIINSYTDVTQIVVKGNSPRQVVVEVAAVGAYDAIISIESVR